MRSTQILEMLNTGKIEDLKAALQDEIYAESLKGRSNAKKRYTAMKKYFTYAGSIREALSKPCPVEFEGTRYTSFCNSYSLALTSESTGEIALCDEPDRYPDISRLVRFKGEERKIDFTKVIAEAKSKGYKLKKSEFFSNKFLMHYDGAYYRMMLLDSTFGIIDDGKEVTVYHENNTLRPLTIKNDIGICVIMPVRIDDPEEDGLVIIEVN